MLAAHKTWCVRSTGGASALELAEAEQTVASQQAAHALLVQQRVEFTNSLTILFDGPPDRSMPTRPASHGTRCPKRAPACPPICWAPPDLRAAELRCAKRWRTWMPAAPVFIRP